jgi:arylsulfatase
MTIMMQSLHDDGMRLTHCYRYSYYLQSTTEHGLSEKWYAFDQSIQVPLVIQDPRMPEEIKGTVNHEYTLNVDLAPTILSAAKIPIPPVMQGRDIAELYLNPIQAGLTWRKDFYYEWVTDHFDVSTY